MKTLPYLGPGKIILLPSTPEPETPENTTRLSVAGHRQAAPAHTRIGHRPQLAGLALPAETRSSGLGEVSRDPLLTWCHMQSEKPERSLTWRASKESKESGQGCSPSNTHRSPHQAVYGGRTSIQDMTPNT